MIFKQVGEELTTTAELPNLSAAVRLCVDIETYDPNLKISGPSVRTGGYVAGLGVGAELDDGSVVGFYIPVDHEGYASECLDVKVVMPWLKDLASHPTREVVLARALYDMDYLAHLHGVDFKGKIIDVQVAEPLIDENAKQYSLGALAEKYLGESKVDDELYIYCANRFGGRATRTQAGNIYRCPPDVVARYGIGDVTLPLRVWECQREELSKQALWPVFDLEAALVPMLLDMKARGVRVNMAQAEEVQSGAAKRMISLQKEIDEMAGMPIAVYEATTLEEAYKKLELPYPRTEAGNASFTAAVLDNSAFGSKVNECRKATKMHDVFLDSYINNYVVRDRIHPDFNALRGDDYGTVTGRFSSSMPNLQNIPNDPMIRSLYVPEDGESWYKLDYSSVEYRLALHYAKGPAAEAVRAKYASDPNYDAHQATANDIGISRTQAKTINFGLIYGMGVKLLSAQLGVTMTEGKQILHRFHDNVPFMKELLNLAMAVAEKRGHVHTLAGRRRRFNTYEPRKWQAGKFAKPHAEALHEYGTNIKRAFTYKALNAIVQGSGADVMKKAMVDIHQSGVCDVIGVPMLTVHDELDFSADGSAAHQEALREVKHLMETAFTVKVPLIVDVEMGPSWGQVKEVAL